MGFLCAASRPPPSPERGTPSTPPKTGGDGTERLEDTPIVLRRPGLVHGDAIDAAFHTRLVDREEYGLHGSDPVRPGSRGSPERCEVGGMRA